MSETTDFKPEEEMTADELTQLQEAEKFLLEFKEEDLQDPDKAEELGKRLKDAQTTIHQKRHYRDQVNELKKNLPPVKPAESAAAPEKKPAEEAAPEGVSRLAFVELRQEYPDLSKEVAKEILEYASAKKISPEDAMKSPIIQTMVREDKAKRDAEDASIASGQRSGTGAQPKDWSQATEAEVVAERQRIQASRGG